MTETIEWIGGVGRVGTGLGVDCVAEPVGWIGGVGFGVWMG